MNTRDKHVALQKSSQLTQPVFLYIRFHFFPQQIQDEDIIQTKSFTGTTLYNQRRKNERMMLNDQNARRNKIITKLSVC